MPKFDVLIEAVVIADDARAAASYIATALALKPDVLKVERPVVEPHRET